MTDLFSLIIIFLVVKNPTQMEKLTKCVHGENFLQKPLNEMKRFERIGDIHKIHEGFPNVYTSK